MAKKNTEKDIKKETLKEVLDIIDNRIEHCQWQINRFKKEGDKESAIDWFHKQSGCFFVRKEIEQML